MKISLITATFNSSLTVTDTLQSVAKQTHPDIEHIIIDGNSSDETLDIIKKFPHVQKVVSEKDKGIYDAMNKGITLASGDIIGIINSDDYYANERVIEKIAAAFNDQSIDMVYGDMQYIDKNNSSKIIRNWKAGEYSASAFYYGWMPPHPTLFVRKKIYDQVGLFNITLKSSADYELMIRLFVKHQFNSRYLPELLVKMRAGGFSNASFANRLRANKEDHLAWKLNGLRPAILTRFLKPIRKIFQFRP